MAMPVSPEQVAVPRRRRNARRRKVTPHKEARETLRCFARFVEEEDPVALAAVVTEVRKTLASCARIELFFRRYVAALRQAVQQ